MSVWAIILMLLLGASLKSLDACCDEEIQVRKLWVWVIALLVAVVHLALCFVMPIAAVMGLAMAIGCLVTGKLDHKAFMIPCLAVVSTSIIFFPLMTKNWIPLAVCILGYAADEIVNDRVVANTAHINRTMFVLVKLRFIGKLVAGIVSAVTMVPIYFAYCILHDTGYHLVAAHVSRQRKIVHAPRANVLSPHE